MDPRAEPRSEERVLAPEKPAAPGEAGLRLSVRAPGPWKAGPSAPAVPVRGTSAFVTARGEECGTSRRLTLSPLKVKEKRGWTLNSAGYLLGPRK